MESVKELHENYVKAGYWRNENIYSYLLKAAECFPQKVAVVDNFQKLTYQELNEQVKKLAGGLLALGVNKGDVVSFQLPNWIECVIIHQAVSKIGAVSNPIIPIYRYKEVNYIIKQSNTKVFIIPNKFREFDYLEMTRSLLENGQINSLEKVLVVDKYSENPVLNPRIEIDFNYFLQNSQIDDNVAVINETDPALLLYTSGTTATQKGFYTHIILYSTKIEQ